MTRDTQITCETTITHRAGRLVSLTVTIMRATEGDAILGVYSIAKDITERKQAEAKTRDGEERLRLALKSGKLGSTLSRKPKNARITIL